MSTIKSSAENLTLNADGANNDIKFQSNGSEVASIDQAGKLTASALAVDNFLVDGTTIALSSGDQMVLDSAGRIDLSADDNGEIRLFDGSSKYGQFKDDSDRLSIQCTIQDKDMMLVGNDGGSEVTALRLDMSEGGRAIFNAGVALGGTGADNTLDDYEEGNHTATITTASGTITLYGAINNLTYTKIGRVVTVTGLVAVQAFSSPSGATFISLPFTCADGTDKGGLCSFVTSCYYNGSNITDGHYTTTFLLAEGTATARVLVNKTIATRVDIGDQVGTGSDIVVALSYQTDA